MFRRTVFWSVVSLLLGAGAVRAEKPQALDFSTWRRLPVFHRGRRMPLDTFARSAVRDLCGKEKPTLRLLGAGSEKDIDSPDLQRARDELFPDDRPRKFDPAELIFSWLVEPEKWEYVPFLHAEHEELRLLLGVPLRNSRGDRLKFVSPQQVEIAEAYEKEAEVIRAKREAATRRGEKYDPTGLDAKVNDLDVDYDLYRRLSGGPKRVRGELARDLGEMKQIWEMLYPALKRFSQQGLGDKLADKVEEANQALQAMVAHSRQEWTALDDVYLDVYLIAVRLEHSTGELARVLEHVPRPPDGAPPGTLDAWDRFEPVRDHLVEMIRDLSDRAYGTRRVLYGDFHPRRMVAGNPLRMVPGLNPDGLDPTSRRTYRPVSPWLSFDAMVYGPVELFCMYVPHGANVAAQAKLRRPHRNVRKAFAAVKTAYDMARDNPDRPEEFGKAMEKFEKALRKLGQEVGPLRARLRPPTPTKDEDLKYHARLRAKRLDTSTYPAAGEMDLEVHYNRLSPFLWSWIVSLAAVFAFALSFGVIRRAMYWLGAGLLGIAMLVMIYGLTLRYLIAGWVPVTNMFESVVFVALTVSLLGLWFALVPMFWSGWKVAWGLTAFPKIIRYWPFVRWYELYRQWRTADGDTAQAASPEKRDTEPETPEWVTIVNWALLVPQILLMVWIFYELAVAYNGSGGESPIFRWWPKADEGAAFVSINNLLTWLAGLCVLLPSVLFLPRIALASLVCLGTVPYSWKKEDVAEMLSETYRRKVYVAVGAAVGCFASIIAYYAPVEIIKRDVGPLMPALHDNFWLTVHVLPILASYGAGALAWGLGNIALAYYLFGSYRKPSEPTGGERAPLAARPPEACATLARYTYKAILVAVLLLIAGTILGALWADFAWGRFWGWDAKEVWSLVSILAYLVILHGRYAGWSGNFGLAAGAVLGLTCILMAWYGVNYILASGLHSYGGGGSGGGLPVYLAVVFNWLFLIAAAVRYNLETHAPLTQTKPLPPGPSTQTDPGLP